MDLSIYGLKPKFQKLLRPIVVALVRGGVSANLVTMAACTVSVALGVCLYLVGQSNVALYLWVPVWMLVRMAMNAIDGMMAREFDQQTPLGAYLNELSDVVSDAALYLPFITVSPFGWERICLLIFLAAVSEITGVLGLMVGAPRQYGGPMGKSDRAFVFGVLGLWLGVAGSLPKWCLTLIDLVNIAILLNIFNRIRSGLAAVK